MAIKNFIFKTFGAKAEPEEDQEYLELSPVESNDEQKVLVRAYTLNEFSDIKPVLHDLREGYIICFVNIKPLKEKDVVELKRAISKFKSAIETLGGDIAGVSEDWIIITPAFAEIDKSKKSKTKQLDDE